MNTKAVAAVFFLSIISGHSLIAQNSDANEVRAAQVTFGYPLGSNGISSMNYTNRFSLNILYGLNGGVSGMEIGSIINFIKGNVRGIQLSGVANINTGETAGLQLAGVLNINKETKGIQMSGVSNVNLSGTAGLQISTVNIVPDDFLGFQLGVVNYVKNLTGIQLGVVNYVENSEKGIPVGIISIVKNGHYELELTGGETIYLNLNYKMGVERFYTIFKAGVASFSQNPVYSFGLGFGGMITFNDKNRLSIDASGNQIVYNNDWVNEQVDLLNKVDINYKYAVFPGFSLLIGPSFNIYVTDKVINNKYGALTIPYHLYSNETSDNKNKTYLWIGLNAGLSYKF